MASRKDKKDVTAEELIDKLGKGADDKKFTDKIMPIDMPDDESSEYSEDLDISELMKKYMPEYEEGSEETEIGDDKITPEPFDDEKIEQLGLELDEPADDDGDDGHSEISFADSIFSEYELSAEEEDEPVKPKEMNGSREEDDGTGHEIESERTRRFLSSLLHRDHATESDTDDEPDTADDEPAEPDDTYSDEKTGFDPLSVESDEEFLKAFSHPGDYVDREDLIDDEWTEDEDEDERPEGTFGAKPKNPFEEYDEDGGDEETDEEPLSDGVSSATEEIFAEDEVTADDESDDEEDEEDLHTEEEYRAGAEKTGDEILSDLFATVDDETEDEESETDADEPDDTDEDDGNATGEDDSFDDRDREYDDENESDEGEDEYDAEYDGEDSEDKGEDFDDKKQEGEVDPTDISLMIAFDIDSDDEETNNRAKELGDKLETKHGSGQRKKYKLDRPEYVDKSQTAEIRAEFRKKRSSLTIRAIICAFCVIGLFVFENITTITQLFTGHQMQFDNAFNPQLYPVVYIMVSLQITLLACLCAIPEIIDGVKYLFMGTPKPSTLTALLAVASVVYAAVLSSIIKSPNEPIMYGFVVALSAFMTIIGEKLNNKREMMNFRVVAGKKPKNVVRRLDDEESECESKAFPSSDRGCDVMKIEKTGFISNFFARLRSPDQTTGTIVTFVMSVIVAVGVVFGIISNFREGVDAAGAWRIIFATMFMLAPVSIQIAFSYPFYRANRAAAEYDSAIIGDVSLEEYSNASIISFDDKNVFPSYSVKVQNIRIYNNARIDRVLYYASSVFAYAGGPLQDVFEIATKDIGTSDNVRIFDTESGFLATQVDGVNIIFGSYDALTSRGLEIPQNAADDDVDFSDDLSIMYMFRESVLVAKMYIKYDMDEDIDVILKQFAGDGLYVCVRTFDPNIDEKMVARKLGVKHVPLKVVRYVSTDEVGKYEEKVDSGLVTSSSPKSLLQVVSYCEKVKLARKTNTAFGVISLIIGVLLMMFIVLSNSISALSSFLIAVYQIVWVITMVIASKIHIR